MLFRIGVGGILGQPHEGDLAYGAVAVFKQYSLCQIGIFHLGIIVAVAVKAEVPGLC